MTTKRNTVLIETLQHFQATFSEGISEYHLIELLKQEPYALFNKDALSDSLALFQTHFVLFNALYQLQQRWRLDKTGVLRIHTTHIVLEPFVHQGAAIAEPDQLAAYYLDWDNFTNTKVDEVDQMLDDFWQRMAGVKSYDEAEILDARNVMQIPEDARLSRTLLKQQFRRLQHQHHPDKGGDPEKSKHIVAAFETLIKSI
ncbi:DNA-J related domain-containing protein [Alteromonas ponticola]|uniref:Molecular chaperone DnaJ n=1 Tax=Alteromonas ponticola TaxID=2720613 RepID=A0ABX1R330_9ALTE|nr:DNA-J related domain-containing protein [Alteromonas ponticola]NMH59886.1 molecular chaperone DnaJ [Alteromonas ponticola]